MLDDLAEQEIKTDKVSHSPPATLIHLIRVKQDVGRLGGTGNKDRQSFTLTPCHIDFHLIRVKQDVGRLGGTGKKDRQSFTLTPCHIDFHLIRVKQDVGQCGGTGSKDKVSHSPPAT
ncbi:hypothetical protein RRG08_037870 [Elysia crispata]|uniref:Uncharacterized protein n=1 Tax=Elysia crispata TaxID=231223 RepID=A0AAE0ZJL9_9GAST|nr:hypothetical protein RRG08_037870 [Elysia crispata]